MKQFIKKIECLNEHIMLKNNEQRLGVLFFHRLNALW
jgi:hypothetical protein